MIAMVVVVMEMVVVVIAMGLVVVAVRMVREVVMARGEEKPRIAWLDVYQKHPPWS